MASRHHSPCEHRRSGAGGVAPQPVLNLPANLVAELDALAAANPPYKTEWRADEIAVLKKYAAITNNRRVLAQIMNKAFPGRRTYTVNSVSSRLRSIQQGRRQ